MGSLERSFDNGVRRAVTGRTRQVNRAGANDRYRRGAEVHYEITCFRLAPFADFQATAV
jgi:hypothetical protein